MARSRSRSRQAPPMDLTPVVLLLTFIAAPVAVWLGYPGLALLPVGFTVAGWMAIPPELSGKKSAVGRPRPADETEALKQRRFFTRADWKLRMLLPNLDWLPGWPPLGIWLVAVAAAMLALLLPAGRDGFELWNLDPLHASLINAAGVYIVICQAAASARKFASEDEASPGVRLDSLMGFLAPVLSSARLKELFARLAARVNELSASLRRRTRESGAQSGEFDADALTAGLVGAAGEPSDEPVTMKDKTSRWLRRQLFELLRLGMKAATYLGSTIAVIIVPGALIGHFVGRRLLTAADTALRQLLAHQVPGVGELGLHLWQVPEFFYATAFGSLIVTALLWPQWSKTALSEFRARVRARRLWKPRWESLKFDPAPHLIEHADVGPATVDTFAAPGGQSAASLIAQADKIAPSVGAGMKVTLLEVPDTDSRNNPMPGTVHPQRFAVVAWPADQPLDVTDPSVDVDQLRLAVETAIIGMCVESGFARIRLDNLAPVHGPDSAAAVWYASPQPDAFPLMVYLRNKGEQRLMSARLGGVPVVINHRHNSPGGPAFYFGAIGDENFTPAEDNGDIAELIEQLGIEDEWNARWGAVLKTGTNFPVPAHDLSLSRKLAGGGMLHRQGFVVRQGEQPADFFGFEHKLASTLSSTNFVATTGFLLPNSAERHAGGVVVSWADPGVVVPRSPIRLTPPQRMPRSPGESPEAWVLAGMVNSAFDAAKLARPELYAAHPLTRPSDSAHIWEARLRLYGGVTSDMVRKQAEKIRETLDVPWVRVAAAKHGVSLFVGAHPETVALANERRDRPRIVAMDWAQAFADSRLTGVNGALPQLEETHTMEHNDKVRSITFTLPSGLDMARVRRSDSVGRLRAATGNTFISVEAHPSSASKIVLLAAESDPMPAEVGYPFEAPVDEGGAVVIGKSVDGRMISTRWADNPHIIITGGTGSGKTVTGCAIMFGSFAAGCRIAIIDIQKQGADFAFAREHAIAFCTEVEDARAALEALYAQVRHQAYINGQYGVSSIDSLPAEIRPQRTVIVIDEFVGLITAGSRPSSRPEADPKAEEARLAELANYENRARIAYLVGRLAAEARSAGMHLLLLSQKMSKDSLPKSLGDLKTNSARILQGQATDGERVSALRNPYRAPDLGDVVPVGRLVWESMTTPPIIAQACYASSSDFGEQIEAVGAGLPPVSKLDLDPYRPVKREVRVEGQELSMQEVLAPTVVDATDAVFDDDEAVEVEDLPEWAHSWFVDPDELDAPPIAPAAADEVETESEMDSRVLAPSFDAAGDSHTVAEPADEAGSVGEVGAEGVDEIQPFATAVLDDVGDDRDEPEPEPPPAPAPKPPSGPAEAESFSEFGQQRLGTGRARRRRLTEPEIAFTDF